jgi:cold shock CspA family protein
MHYGTIVQFFPAKGFGFIRADSGSDVFFHVTAIGACDDQPQIEVGHLVKFELEPGEESKARFVELADHVPPDNSQAVPNEPLPRHPRARKKKPTWRR